jgi:hypothetical protein
MSADDIFAGSGSCWSGPQGTTLPTDVGDMTSLDSALVDLGLVSEDGLETSFSVDKTVLKDWSGQAVRVFGTSTEITFKLTFLEQTQEVVETYYGADVTATATGSKVEIGQPSDEAHCMVIPTEDPATGKMKIYCLPRVEVKERDDQTIKPDETGYGITFQALLDPTLGSCGYILFDEDLTGTSS